MKVTQIIVIRKLITGWSKFTVDIGMSTVKHHRAIVVMPDGINIIMLHLNMSMFLGHTHVVLVSNF